jgi:hypothetical protein
LRIQSRQHRQPDGGNLFRQPAGANRFLCSQLAFDSALT